MNPISMVELLLLKGIPASKSNKNITKINRKIVNEIIHKAFGIVFLLIGKPNTDVCSFLNITMIRLRN